MTRPFETIPELSELYEHAWTQLVRGARDRRHGFHHPTVSTIRSGRPEGRVVVLRQALPEAHELVFHTDTRSAKLDELEHGVSFTLYDYKRRFQVRAWGPAQIADRERTDARWAASSAPSRKCYLEEPAPGTPVEAWTSGFPDDLEGAAIPELDRTESGRGNFSVVVTRIQSLELLVIRRAGHIRARFAAEGDWAGTWLVP